MKEILTLKAFLGSLPPRHFANVYQNNLERRKKEKEKEVLCVEKGLPLGTSSTTASCPIHPQPG